MLGSPMEEFGTRVFVERDFCIVLCCAVSETKMSCIGAALRIENRHFLCVVLIKLGRRQVFEGVGQGNDLLDGQ